MSSRVIIALVATARAGAVACRIQDNTSPRSAAAVGVRSEYESEHQWTNVPGSHRAEASTENPGGLVACSQRTAQSGSALIGPSGGVLVVGRNRLIVPAGALTTTVLITGTVPAEPYAAIHFEPTGLQFRKPAGLVLDGAGCDVPPDDVHVDYVGDDGTVLERIDAEYSNWWRTVAAPINHFSVYAIGL